MTVATATHGGSPPEHNPEPRSWDALPRNVLAQMLKHVPRSGLASAALTCWHWHSVLCAHVPHLRCVPLDLLSHLLDRFPAAYHVTLADGMEPGHAIGLPHSREAVASALLACSRPLQQLTVGPRLAAADAIEVLCSLPVYSRSAQRVSYPAAAVFNKPRISDWGTHMASLDIDLSFVQGLPKCFGQTALPALRTLTMRNYCGPTHGLAPLLACSGLKQLSVRGLYSGLPPLGALLHLQRLQVVRAFNLTELFSEVTPPPELQELRVLDCQRLASLDLTPLKTSLTSLVMRGCPALLAPAANIMVPGIEVAATTEEAAEPAAAAAGGGGGGEARPLLGLEQLIALRRLELGASPGQGLVQLPQGITGLTALTALILLNGSRRRNHRRGRGSSADNRRGNSRAASIHMALLLSPAALTTPVLRGCISLQMVAVGRTTLRGADLRAALGR